MGAEVVGVAWIVGAAAACAHHLHSGSAPAEALIGDNILCQSHEQNRRRDRLAPQPVREAFAILALVGLTQRVDEARAEAQSFGQPLRDFTMPAELLFHELR